LGNTEFKFQVKPEAGIYQILVTQLRLTLKHGDKRRITLEADTKNNHQAAYDLLAELSLTDFFVATSVVG